MLLMVDSHISDITNGRFRNLKGGYILGVHFWKCSNVWTLKISTSFFHLQGAGARARPMLNTWLSFMLLSRGAIVRDCHWTGGGGSLCPEGYLSRGHLSRRPTLFLGYQICNSLKQLNFAYRLVTIHILAKVLINYLLANCLTHCCRDGIAWANTGWIEMKCTFPGLRWLRVALYNESTLYSSDFVVIVQVCSCTTMEHAKPCYR